MFVYSSTQTVHMLDKDIYGMNVSFCWRPINMVSTNTDRNKGNTHFLSSSTILRAYSHTDFCSSFFIGGEISYEDREP